MDHYLNNIKNTIISEYGVRFFPKQKKRFREFVKEEIKEYGWETEIIKGNIVVGDIEKAEYIYTAHYDTPGKIPLYARGAFRLFGNTSIILAPLLMIIVIILFSALLAILAYQIGLEDIADIAVKVLYILLIAGLFIPNKNNYNDNTSGILTLMNIAYELSIQDIDKDKVAFVFFNNEEWGLLGSRDMKKHWKRNKVSLEGKQIINFDCVGNGDTILITHGKDDKFAKEIQERLQMSTIYNVQRFRYNILPLSDDFRFKDKGAIGIVFCKKAKLGKGVYIPDVHCNKDISLDLNNVEFLTKEVSNLQKI